MFANSCQTAYLFQSVCHQESYQAQEQQIPKEAALDGLGRGEIWGYFIIYYFLQSASPES